MATPEASVRAHDRHGRRYTFANWMKRLANIKGTSDAPSSAVRRHSLHKTKKNQNAKNNPYPLSGRVAGSADNNGQLPFSNPANRMASSEPSLAESGRANSVRYRRRDSAVENAKSVAGETTMSEAQSKAGTAFTTATHGVSTQYGGEGSTFSSRPSSVRSLSTTLTTVQSANGNNGPGAVGAVRPHRHSYGFHTQQIGSPYVPQFPTSTQHSATALQPNTYSSATANNLLSDNASVLTLASSSKQPRRRNSLDTNASIRGLPPSSMFSNSRESLPLSVLSEMVGSNMSNGANSTAQTPAVLVEPPSSLDDTALFGQAGALNSSERLSVYSSTGMTNVNTERSSYHRRAADAASVRSGRSRHQRSESSPTPLSASPPAPVTNARLNQALPETPNGG